MAARRQQVQRFGACGFTLVELVVVIVLMSLVSLAGVEMIRYAADSYQKMSSRQALGSASRVAVERISRDLRGALPNSVRVNALGNCLEFIPVKTVGTYITLPVDSPGNSFASVPLSLGQEATVGPVVVYPLTTAKVYSAAGGVMSSAASVSAPDVDNVVTVSLAANFQFALHSPTSRYFLVDTPVSYCVDGGYLFRYRDYGVLATQPSVATLPAALPTRALLADGLGISADPFQLATATLVRNALVTLDLLFVEAGESTRLVSEVQLRNVP